MPVMARTITKLKIERMKRGLTQQELSRRAKINITYLQQIEGGMRPPTLSQRKRLAKALKISLKAVDSLLEEVW
jgi:transcriptional regulator with XRE-family HTH domain